MYISTLWLFIAVEIVTVIFVVSLLALRLYIRRLKTAAPAKPDPLAVLSNHANNLPDNPLGQARKAHIAQELEYLQGSLSEQAYLTALQPQVEEGISDAAQKKIRELEETLEQKERKLSEAVQALQKMAKKDSENAKAVPKSNEQVDEIYRLKCERFDLHEKINALSMQLDQLIPEQKDNLTSLLLEQIDTLKAAAKESDRVIELLEEQVATADAATSEPVTITDDALPEQPPNDWEQFRQTIQQKLNQLKAEVEQQSPVPESSDDAQDARELLSAFVQDSQEMMHCINELESDNHLLKQQIHELQAMVDSGGNVEAAAKIKSLKEEVARLNAQLEA